MPQMSFLFFLQLGIACVFAGILGLSEAFRYRLPNSKVGKLTTVLFLLALVSWLAVILWSALSLGFLQAAAIFVIPFLAGNLIRWWFGDTSSNDLLSEKSLARSQYERDLAVQKSEAAVESSELEDVVEKFDLKTDDFVVLYDSIRRAGIEHGDALRAMNDKRVIEWYFENKGKEGRFSEGESLEFTMIVKNSL